MLDSPKSRLAALTTHEGEPPEPGRVLFRSEFPSSFVSGRLTIENVLVVLRAYGYVTREHEEIHARLCLDETVSNAIRHGNRLDERKLCKLTLFESPVGWAVRVEDQGEGFDPEGLPDPLLNVESDHGRGVFLVRSFMDRVDYFHGGRCVQIEKKAPG